MAKNDVSKYPYPEMPEFGEKLTDADKAAKAEVLRIRAESTRHAQRDVVAALTEAADDVTAKDIKATVAEALAYLAERAKGRKGTPGEGALRAPKSNVVADYFKGKNVGDKIDAADAFFDLDMDPARVLGSLKRFVSTVKDKDARVWVSYDKANRVYVVSGYGATKPHDFTAYDAEENAADIA